MINIIHPEIRGGEQDGRRESAQLSRLSTALPKSLRNQFITSKTISKLTGNLLQQLKSRIPETLPDYLIIKYKLMELHDALNKIHFPENPDELEKARYSLKFEELFYIQLNLLRFKTFRNIKQRGFVFSSVGCNFNNFISTICHFHLLRLRKGL